MEFNTDKFGLIEDAEGKIALVCPAPLVMFQDIDEFIHWIEELKGISKNLRDTSQVSSIPISNDYSNKVIEEWQSLISQSQKNNGTEK
jgi:hypothetical protein|tara:strand:+ start:249 stop:512 length:264 start_codon:yes stop_codon:yes gene_type:complete